MNVREPSKLEMQVLGVLWQRGPSSVREVLDALPDGKSRAYTTVLTVLQVMEKKGLLSHTTLGNAHVYAARVTRRQALGPALRGLLNHVFGGSPAAAMQHLLAESEVTHEELDKLKEMIRDLETANPGKPGERKKP